VYALSSALLQKFKLLASPASASGKTTFLLQSHFADSIRRVHVFFIVQKNIDTANHYSTGYYLFFSFFPSSLEAGRIIAL